MVSPTADPERPLFQPSGTHDSSTLALNLDGSRALVSYQSKLELRDTADGSVLGTVDPSFLGTERQAYHPEWSPTDDEIVVTLSDAADSEWAVRTGQIAILPYNGGAFGPARVVAPSGADFHFYPSWSPDGKWIVFVSTPSGLDRISYDQADTRLRLVSRDGGPIFDLANATQVVGRTSTWPKFSPYLQADGNVMFITFNSKIDYGFLLENDGRPNGGVPQLWMAAVDAAQAGGRRRSLVRARLAPVPGRQPAQPPRLLDAEDRLPCFARTALPSAAARPNLSGGLVCGGGAFNPEPELDAAAHVDAGGPEDRGRVRQALHREVVRHEVERVRRLRSQVETASQRQDVGQPRLQHRFHRHARRGPRDAARAGPSTSAPPPSAGTKLPARVSR